MAGNSKGLGKGLGALMGDDMMDLHEEKNSLLLPISQVESCAAQPRKLFDPDALADLADSIRQHGIIQPLTVRKLQSGYYQIIAGERRWRAARMAGLTQVPAVVIEADDRKAMELAMIENLQREDLNPIEEAEGYKVLMEQYGMTQEETAKRVGKSRPAVANAMRLLHLCEPVRAMVEDGRLSGGHARALLPLPAKQQETAAAAVLKNDLSVRQTELLGKKLLAETPEKPAKDPLTVNYAEEAAKELGERLGRGCRIVTGRTSGLMGASCAALLNALKLLAGIDDKVNLISPMVLAPIQHLKVEHLGNTNPRLHTDEVLIALSMSAVTNPTAELAMEALAGLRGSEVHSSVILSSVDENVFKKLGANVTFEPVYQTHSLYHK